MRISRTLLGAAVACLTAACANVDTDPNETEALAAPPTVLFAPIDGVVPTPNDEFRSELTRRIALPAPCNETSATRPLRLAVNQLDGFGLSLPQLRFTTSTAIDEASLARAVRLYKIEVDGRATPVDFVANARSLTRVAGNCVTVTDPGALVIPAKPLAERTTYVVVVGDELQTTDAQPFAPSPTWSLVRQAANPITIRNGAVVAERTPLDPSRPGDADELLAIAQIWERNASTVALALQAASLPRERVLLAWSFTTQTANQTLAPTVVDSVAANVLATPLRDMRGITIGVAEPFMTQALGTATCDIVGCSQVGEIWVGSLDAQNYQQPLPNPAGGSVTVPGNWSDPSRPRLISSNALRVLAFTPAAAPPPAGYPVVIFAHDLGDDRTGLFLLASQLAKAGYASVAIDMVGHGTRAVRTSFATAIGCGDRTIEPASKNPACFAPFVSASPLIYRDNVRQSALDFYRLSRAVTQCNNCNGLRLDARRVGIVGIGFGAVVASLVTAMDPSIDAAVLSAVGGGLLDLAQFTSPLPRCRFVDALIAAGHVSGMPSNPDGTLGACTENAWLSQVKYRNYAEHARWLLDPADPSNFASAASAKKLLVQKIDEDTVIASAATDSFSLLAGLALTGAGVATSDTPSPSPALATDPTASQWVRYLSLPADPATNFVGNRYSHSSLLTFNLTQPDTVRASLQMQADLIAFLSANL